jgi:hypothetical protein
MKKLSILFLVLALSGSISAQIKTDTTKVKQFKGFYLSVSSGVSFPVGNSYISVDGKDTKSGYAGTGYLVQVNGDWPGNNMIGLGLQYTYQRNPILASAHDIVRDGNDTTPIGSGAWANHYLMIGPVFVKQVHKLLISARMAVGFIVSFSPVFRYIDPVTQRRTNNMAYGLGYGLSAGVGYSVSERVSLQMNVSYYGGAPKLSKEYKPQVTGWDTITNTNIFSPLTEISIKKIVSTINLSAGAVFKF